MPIMQVIDSAAMHDNVIVVPRNCVMHANDTCAVRVLAQNSSGPRTITLGPMNDHEAVVASGLEPGVTVQRYVAQ